MLILRNQVTIEMHQQSGDRSCSNEAIGGAHYGPVLVRTGQHSAYVVVVMIQVC